VCRSLNICLLLLTQFLDQIKHNTELKKLFDILDEPLKRIDKNIERAIDTVDKGLKRIENNLNHATDALDGKEISKQRFC
jgi:hypothetical protein